MDEILEAIRDQWSSMLGMAGMFTVSILIGVFIQPFYNFDTLRAFGEEGTTEAGNVIIELMMIFIFTIGIIYLARKGLDVVIKAIVFLALGYSLLIAIDPILAIPMVLLELGGDWNYVRVAFSLSLSIGLMFLLHKFPEWYVVNAIGVLVGSGVIVMLGITFVPVLIILFMVQEISLI